MNNVVDLYKLIDYFRIYFDMNIYQTIVDESNLYASQQNTQLGLDTEELHIFLGILIVMGSSLPTLRSYWSKNENFHVERVTC